MRGILLLSSLLFSFQFGWAQNMVNNASFEQYLVCPKDLGKRMLYIKEWTQPTAGSVDYFNRCSQKCGVPSNLMGFQEARSGDGYIGLYLFHENYREYIQAKFREPLQQGVSYNVEFYVSLSEKSEYAIGNIGAFISTERIKSNLETVFECYTNKMVDGANKLVKGPCGPQIENGATNYRTDLRKWMKVSGVYHARGGERYITIGNFYDNRETPVQKSRGNGGYSYYFIDDIAVYETGSTPPLLASANGAGRTEPEQPAAKSSANNKPEQIAKKQPKKMIAKLTVPELSEAEKNAVSDPIIMSDLHFEKNSKRILPESEDELTNLADMMSLNPNMKVMIIGHTDETGSEETNLKLSIERAEAVVNFLRMYDIDDDRLFYKGYGSSKPLASNETEEGRQLNRRVEFLVLEQ